MTSLVILNDKNYYTRYRERINLEEKIKLQKTIINIRSKNNQTCDKYLAEY